MWRFPISAPPCPSSLLPKTTQHGAPPGAKSRQSLPRPSRPASTADISSACPSPRLRAGLCSSAEIFLELLRHRPCRSRSGGKAAAAPLPGGRAGALSLGPILAHLDVFGEPAILCSWGLGVDASILERCSASVRVYNSIDVAALRIPRR